MQTSHASLGLVKRPSNWDTATSEMDGAHCICTSRISEELVIGGNIRKSALSPRALDNAWCVGLAQRRSNIATPYGTPDSVYRYSTIFCHLANECWPAVRGSRLHRCR